MKTIIISLFFVGFATLSSAQKDNQNDQTNDLRTTNFNYLKLVNNEDSAKKVIKMHDLIANFDVTSMLEYDSKSNKSYEVVFEDASCEITVKYDKYGEILRSKENYSNLRLPNKLMVQISKTYPEWKLNSNQLQILYSKDKDVIITYNVQINNGDDLKVVKYNRTSDYENTFLAVN